MHSGFWSESELYYDRRSVGQPVLVSSLHLGLMTRCLLLSDNCGFVDMGRPLWREDGSVVYNCCCLRQRSHSQVQVPRGSWPHFTVSNLRLPPPGGQGPCIYIPQEQGGPVIPPGTGFSLTFADIRVLHFILTLQPPCPHVTWIRPCEGSTRDDRQQETFNDIFQTLAKLFMKKNFA
jgi:hypothetical protein